MDVQLRDSVHLRVQVKEARLPKKVLDVLLTLLQEQQIEFLLRLANISQHFVYNYNIFVIIYDKIINYIYIFMILWEWEIFGIFELL